MGETSSPKFGKCKVEMIFLFIEELGPGFLSWWPDVINIVSDDKNIIQPVFFHLLFSFFFFFLFFVLSLFSIHYSG